MLTKYLLPLAILGGFAGGSFFGTKVLAPKPQKIEIPKCPDCNCPAAVSLQNFDLEKLNNKKGNFTYSPQISDVRIVIESKDSTLLKQMLKQAK